MPEILTTGFKTDSTKRLVNEALTTDEYYVFVSSIAEFDPSDSIASKNEFLEKTLFAKKVSVADIHYMIKNYPWQIGQVYTEYDDTVDLSDKNFYAIVGPNYNDTGDYRVYKCIKNNNGAPVSNPPNYDETVNDQLYETSDGYVWKFMYAITNDQYEAYSGLGYVPLLGDVEPDTPVEGGEVFDIVVENPDDNFGYIVEEGVVIGNPFSNGLIYVDPTTTWSQTTNYYSGQYAYFTNPNGVSRIFELEYYAINDAGVATLRVGQELLTGELNPLAAGVSSNARVKIFPKIKIKGDGQSKIDPALDPVAIPNIQNNRIISVDILEEGQGYHNVVAEVVDPVYDFDPESDQTTDVRAIIRARISPDGGHGHNLLQELQCRHFLLYAYITAEDNTKIGYSNTYGSVGVVKNPQFAGTSPVVFDNRIEVVTSDIGNVTVNTVVTQTNAQNEVVFSGLVHAVDVPNNTFYIAEYMGPYRNNPGSGNGDTSFDLTLPLRNETGQTITINSPAATNVTFSEYIQRSGEIYFMENFFPLPRTDLSREEFKFVLEY